MRSNNRKFLTTHRKQQLMYILLDLFAAVIIWICFLAFRWLVYEERIFGVHSILIPAFSFYRALFLYPVGCIIIYYLSGYYMRPLRHTMSHEFWLTFVSALIISVGAFFIIIIDDNVETYILYYKSLLILFALQFSISYFVRLITTLSVRKLNKEGKFRFNVAVIGTKQEAEDLRQVLTDKNIDLVISESDLDSFNSIKEQHDISEVVIASVQSEKQLYSILNKVYPSRVDISFPARIYDMLIGAARIRTLTSVPLVCITDHVMSDTQLSIKRVSDILLSLLCMTLLAPVYLLISIAIKMDSKGPVIYKQERIGMYGRSFNILKFRTMVPDAELNVPKLSGTNDPRVTHVGHWLRKYRLDELPQFWNVLRGDMSIVGPRPEREYFIRQIIQRAPYYCLLYKIRPGLTSWGPIRVGYTDTLDKMIQRLNYDIVYMENMSLFLDIKIMVYTLKVIIDGKGQ